MRFYFIRHGMTQANAERRYYGATDLPLCEEGIEQLHRLKETLDFPKADCYATSTLCRAVETLQLLYNREPDVKIAELNEFDFGDFEMQTHEQLLENPDYLRWLDDDGETVCPNGESQDIFFARIRQGWQKLQETYCETVVLISHGGVIANLMTMLFPDEKADDYEWLPDHGRGYVVEYSDGPVSWREF